LNLNFWNLPPAQWILRQAKTYTFVGFSGISIYDIIRTFRSDVKQDMLLVRAGALTFNFIMSLFPAIIFLFTLLPYVPVKNLDDQIINFLLLPENAAFFVKTTIHDLVHIKRGGLLSTGFILAIFFSSNSTLTKAHFSDYTGLCVIYFVRFSPYFYRWWRNFDKLYQYNGIYFSLSLLHGCFGALVCHYHLILYRNFHYFQVCAFRKAQVFVFLGWCRYRNAWLSAHIGWFFLFCK
jgi:Virulence factor BrkB